MFDMSIKGLAVFDMNKVLTDKTLAAELLKYRPEGMPIFTAYAKRQIGEREVVVEGSKVYKGLSQDLIQKVALTITPRIDDLRLPGWQTAIISLDYFEAVENVARSLNVPLYFGNKIIYENGEHSGKVEEPVIDFRQKKVIVENLKIRFKFPENVVGLDDEENSPFKGCVNSFYQVKTKDELESALAEIRQS